MATKKQKRKELAKEERELTRKEVRQRASDSARNRKLLGWVGLAIGLALALLIIGLIWEFLITPNGSVVTIGDETIVTRDYRKRVMLERNQLYGQLGQYQRMEEQFGNQGYFTNQISQIQGTLANPETLGVSVLDSLISEKVVLSEAESRGITVSDEEVEQVLREEVAAGQQAVTAPQATETAEMGVEMTATADTWTPTPLPTIDISNTITATAEPVPTATPLPVLSDEMYDEGVDTLASNLKRSTNMSLDDYRQVIYARLVEEELREQVGQESIEETEEQVNARHILLRPRDPTPTPTPIPADVTPEPTIEPPEVPEGAPEPTPTLGPRTREETLVVVQELRQRIEDGEDFAALAIEYSDDTGSGMNGGDLDWFGRGQMVGPFEEAAFSLGLNEVSEPISTTFGYHLIEVLEKDDARPKEENALEQERLNAYQSWLQTQIGQVEIERPESIKDKLPTTFRGANVPAPSFSN